ncbi:anaerobic sulfite reductase subunit AsrA [Cetobacterium sp. SF1]|uniref:anaerobic sulfite reductase subunit AsrA n=1 Tax=Cetobacterium sp. SF1 TaxID=3417654 RepID=UPI003CF60DC6
MGYIGTWENFQSLVEKLSTTYKIYGPKRFPKQGRYSDTDIVRYSRLQSAEELVYEEKSDYSAKEVFSPLTETVLYFTDGDYRESKVVDDRPMLIFARACDIHAIKRYDDIYLKNGGFVDPYFKRMRDKIKFILMECPSKGWDTCFCSSMGTGEADEYAFGVKFNGDSVSFELKDEELTEYFQNLETTDFKVTPVTENLRVVEVPEIPNKDIQQQIKSLEMWKEFDKRCLMCGSCTVSCPTCTCFTTYDMNYTPDSDAGERRRITASCHVDGFTDMAGGHSFRKNGGERMRFKVMHKVHDHKKRFKEHNMCVGCGRCDDKCPVFISFSTTVNKLTKEVKKLVGGSN